MQKIVLILLLGAMFILEFSYGQNKLVIIDQRNSINQQVGVLKKWELSNWSNQFNPGSSFSFLINSNQTFLGDQTVIENQKYNNWNDDKRDVKNFHSFQITPLTNILTSKFEPTNPGITIKTSLEGTEATGGVIEFKDPGLLIIRILSMQTS